MSIFITPTKPLIADVVTTVKMGSTNLYNSIKSQLNNIFNTIWNNPDFTPIEIVTAFGTDAAALFALAQGLQTLASQADPTYVPLVPPTNYTVTINADGSVTIVKTS